MRCPFAGFFVNFVISAFGFVLFVGFFCFVFGYFLCSLRHDTFLIMIEEINEQFLSEIPSRCQLSWEPVWTRVLCQFSTLIKKTCKNKTRFCVDHPDKIETTRGLLWHFYLGKRTTEFVTFSRVFLSLFCTILHRFNISVKKLTTLSSLKVLTC